MSDVQVTETVVIARPVDEVYQAFADLARWPVVLPDVVGVEVGYDDGYNQEFTMTVERPAGNETVRGFRYRRAPRELELCQTTPPPGLSRMVGRWTFTEDGAGTTVTAGRGFTLAGGDEATAAERSEAFAVSLGGYLRTNLRLFKEALEHDDTP